MVERRSPRPPTPPPQSAAARTEGAVVMRMKANLEQDLWLVTLVRQMISVERQMHGVGPQARSSAGGDGADGDGVNGQDTSMDVDP